MDISKQQFVIEVPDGMPEALEGEPIVADFTGAVICLTEQMATTYTPETVARILSDPCGEITYKLVEPDPGIDPTIPFQDRIIGPGQ